MSAQGAAAVAGTAAENADEIAKAASDSTEAVFDSSGFNILLVVGVLGVAYWLFKMTRTASEVTEDVTDGVGDAGEAVGETAGDAYEGTQDMVSDVWDGGQDAARGYGDAVSESADWALGGTADTVEDAGDVFQEAW